jgi:hypothetical protein
MNKKRAKISPVFLTWHELVREYKLTKRDIRIITEAFGIGLMRPITRAELKKKYHS